MMASPATNASVRATAVENTELDAPTHVELTWQAKRVEHWIRFGHPAHSARLDRLRRRVMFMPDSIFGVVRWEANDYGTVMSQVDIIRAVRPGERFTTAAGVRPGGEILLSISGWPKVERALRAIDAVETLGIDPASAAPDHWRHVHNRLTVGERPRPYTLARHRAWLKRRRIVP
jgi:hypothetical protein